MAAEAGVGCAGNRRQNHHSDECSREPCIAIHDALLSLVVTAHGYCSSSPASENALLLVRSAAPQTTLVAEVPVLAPPTSLNALSRLSLHGREQPQTNAPPFTLAP